MTPWHKPIHHNLS